MIDIQSYEFVQSPLGRSPFSLANSLLFSNTCSRAACSLWGRIESSSSSCRETKQIYSQHVAFTWALDIVASPTPPWTKADFCSALSLPLRLLPDVGSGCCRGRPPGPEQRESDVIFLSYCSTEEIVKSQGHRNNTQIKVNSYFFYGQLFESR